MCCSSDFDIAVFNSITAPNPLAVAWGIPRRQGAGGKELHSAFTIAASKLYPALLQGSKGESGQPKSRGAGLKIDSHFSSGLLTGNGGEGSVVLLFAFLCQELW